MKCSRCGGYGAIGMLGSVVIKDLKGKIKEKICPACAVNLRQKIDPKKQDKFGRRRNAYNYMP